MKVLVIDPKIAGISGDMLIAALVDLTGSTDPLESVADAICGISCCDHFSFQVNDVDAAGISAKKLTIEVKEKNHRNHTDMRDSMVEITKKIGLSDTAKTMALGIIDDLLATDAKLHRSGFHHHAMSSVDTLFDVAGSLALLDHHGFLGGEIFGTPPVLGSGLHPNCERGNCLSCPGDAGNTLQAPDRLFFISCEHGDDNSHRSCNFCKYYPQDCGGLSSHDTFAGGVWNRFTFGPGQTFGAPGG